MRYPAWKYLLIIVVLIISTLYALPSLYPDEPAVQISGAKAGTNIDQSVLQKAEQILKAKILPVMTTALPTMRPYCVFQTQMPS
jgi:preprotein translocase subunit SecD